MGIFGYGKGTYKRNANRMQKSICKMISALPRGYEKTVHGLQGALFEFKEAYASNADPEGKAAADARIFRYLDEIKLAAANEDRALCAAYASLLPAAVRSRYLGEPKERERKLELNEQLVIARGRRDSVMDAISFLSKNSFRIVDFSEKHKALEEKLGEANAECERIESELDKLEEENALSDFWDLKKDSGSVAVTKEPLDDILG